MCKLWIKKYIGRCQTFEMKLTFGEKIEIDQARECEELRKNILERANQLPSKIEGIVEIRRLKWINTQMGHVLNEKKPVLNEKAMEASRKRASEYYRKNKERVIEQKENKRRKIREISRSEDYS